MDREARRQFERFRRDTGPVENQVIDDLFAGECDRRGFLQRGAMFGLSASAMSAVLVAAGEAPVAFARSSARKAGGRLRIGISGKPYGAIEPYLFNSTAEFDMASPTAEYLTRVNAKGNVVPELAVAWKPNTDGTEWTITLRPNVKFHTGQPLTADDVVATYKLLSDPAKGSAALTSFKGVLSPDGVTVGPDPLTVIFKLDIPTAAFPYLISSATYQTMILPANYQIGTFTTKSQGTGPYMMTSYVTSTSATYERFEGWWGGRPLLDGIDATVYATNAAMDAALLSGACDLADFASDRALFNKPNLTIYHTVAGSMVQVAMRVDKAPWKDYRVRQALALTIDRPAGVKSVLAGYGKIANDHVFAPVYPYTVPIPQRKKNLAMAKQLLEAAGHPKGFSATLTTGNEPTKVAAAQIVQASAKKVGINIKLALPDSTVYYGGSEKTTPWLNAPFTVTTWAARPIVNQYLTAVLMSGGTWNAARYKNKKFDALAKSFFAAVALADQKKYAKQMETILNRDTPNGILMWMDVITAASPKVKGFHHTPIGFSVSGVSLEA